MSARDQLAGGAKKATAASRHQIHTYIGANDYFYEQARRRPQSMFGTHAKFGTDEASQRPSLGRVLEQYSPKKMRETIQEQVEASRDQRKQFADRGHAIVADWRQASAVQDASSLIHSVRSADGVGGLGRSLKTWLVEFPADDIPTPKRPAAKKPSRPSAARRSPASKSPASKSSAGKSPARRTAGRTAKPSSSSSAPTRRARTAAKDAQA